MTMVLTVMMSRAYASTSALSPGGLNMAWPDLVCTDVSSSLTPFSPANITCVGEPNQADEQGLTGLVREMEGD